MTIATCQDVVLDRCDICKYLHHISEPLPEPVCSCWSTMSNSQSNGRDGGAEAHMGLRKTRVGAFCFRFLTVTHGPTRPPSPVQQQARNC